MLRFLNCIATYFIILAVFYFLSRVYGYVQFIRHKSEIMSDTHMNYAALLHYMQLVHSTLMLVMSVLVLKLARQRTLFRQREYKRIVHLTLAMSIVYILPAFYIGWITYDQKEGLILFLEWMLDVSMSVGSGGCPLIVSMLVHLQLAIIIAALNMVSTLLSEHIQVLNRIRAGGKSEYNALELNKLISDVV